MKRGTSRFRFGRILAAIFVVLLFFYAWNFKRTILFEEKVTSALNRFGCEISHQPFQDKTTLALWASGATSQQYSIGSPQIERVVSKGWLANNSAIYLVLEISYQDSGDSKTTTAHVIYDFRRAELSTLCDLALWRSYNRDGGPIDEGWMTQAEFKVVLSRLQKVQSVRKSRPLTAPDF